MQVKAVGDKYPSRDKLIGILNKPKIKAIGDQFNDPKLSLLAKSTVIDRSQHGTVKQPVTIAEQSATNQ